MKKVAAMGFFFLFLCHASLTYALGVDTHKAINTYIVQNEVVSGFPLDTYLKNSLGLEQGKDTVVSSLRVWKWIELGGLYEDKPEGTIPYRRSFNHFIDPISNRGYHVATAEWLSSTEWMMMSRKTQNPGGHYSWFDARGYYLNALTLPDKTSREANFAETFRGLGQLMHLVADASVPEHVRNDGHILYNYEDWVANPNNVNISAITPVYFGGVMQSPTRLDTSYRYGVV